MELVSCAVSTALSRMIIHSTPLLFFSFLSFSLLFTAFPLNSRFQIFAYATNTLVMPVMPSCRFLSMLAVAIALCTSTLLVVSAVFHYRIFLEFAFSYIATFMIISRNSSCLFLSAYLLYSLCFRSSISISICVHITLL